MTLKTAMTAIAKHYITAAYTLALSMGQVGLLFSYEKYMDGDTTPFTIAYAVSLLGLAAFCFDTFRKPSTTLTAK